MNRLITTIIVCFAAIAAMAQNKADILISYNHTVPPLNGKQQVTKMSLLASQTEAKYFNELSLWVDSLKSTPDGKAKYEDIIEKACMTVEPDGSISFDSRKGPYKKVYLYVFTSLVEDKITLYDRFGEDTGYYTEPMDEQSWQVVNDSTANILGYECLMAETDYHGRHWKVWFTPEIPMPYGPWKLHGLPGMILRADANGGFLLEATGVEKTVRLISPMYLDDEYNNVDRKRALMDYEYYYNNRESILKAQGYNVILYSLDEEGNKIELPKFDGLKHSLEPDYKMK